MLWHSPGLLEPAIRLLRMIGQHMLYAGAAELITDVGLDWLGAELSARLSARLAQGVGAGLLTVRLGLQTMQVCRPIAFTHVKTTARAVPLRAACHADQ